MAGEKNWSEEELRASVESYAEMYKADQEGRRVNKSQMYRELEDRFGRNHKSFERRMQNISHVVRTLGGTYVKGLKPLSHIGPQVQPILEKLILEIGFLEGSDAIQANTTLPLPPDEADQKASELQSDWLNAGKAVLPPNGFQRADKIVTEAIQRKRCAEVKAWVLLQSNGICECCGSEAPFFKDDGMPYLEVHHVVQLADDGPDTTDNAVAVCPNCHRAFHLAKQRGKLVEQIYSRVKRLKRP